MSLYFDRKKFFAGYRKSFGSLTQSQTDGLTFILDSAEKDPLLKANDELGYMLGTTKHETAHTFKPIHEYGGRAYFIRRYGSQTKVGKELGNDTPEEGAIYSGEGDVQLTGETNFEKAENALRKNYAELVADFEKRTGRKFDLTVGDQPGDDKDPANAGDPAIAYAIMSFGMHAGMFTGKKLSDYNLGNVTGRRNARRVINGDVKENGDTIGNYAAKFSDILTESQVTSPQAASPELASAGEQTKTEIIGGGELIDSGSGQQAPTIPAKPEEPVTVQTVAAEPAKTDGLDATLNKWSARFAAIPAAILGVLGTFFAWLKDSPAHVITTFAMVTGAVVILYVGGRQLKDFLHAREETRLKDARELRAHEIQMALIASAANKDANTVVLKKSPPAATEIPNSDPPAVE